MRPYSASPIIRVRVRGRRRRRGRGRRRRRGRDKVRESVLVIMSNNGHRPASVRIKRVYKV